MVQRQHLTVQLVLYSMHLEVLPSILLKRKTFWWWVLTYTIWYCCELYTQFVTQSWRMTKTLQI